jgi:hypothetical protein
MVELGTAWMLGCVCGFLMGVTVASRHRPTCRELMRDHRPDIIPKPQRSGVYRPRSQGGPTNPPPRYP